MKHISLILALGLFVALGSEAQGDSRTRSVASARRAITRPVRQGQSLLVTNKPVLNGVQVVGYSQVITAVGNSKRVTPSLVSSNVAPIAASSCTQDATVQVLATEITYGAGGPLVPTKLFAQMGNDPPEVMFEGDLLSPGMSTTVALGVIQSGGQVVWTGKYSYPNFDSPVLYGETSNFDATNAIVLTNGVNYYTIAAQKGVRPPYGPQPPIPTILSAYINAQTGLVTLPANEIIIAYELGSRNPNSPAFDFNDVIIKVITNCDSGSEVLLRGSIGPDSTTTDGNFMIDATNDSPAEYSVPVITFSASENVVLTEARAIITTSGGAPDWGDWDYEIIIWDSQQSAINSPIAGSIDNIPFNVPSLGPNLFGLTGDWWPFGVMNTFDVRFNIQPRGIQVLAGQTRALVVSSLSGVPPIAIMESTEVGTTDIVVSNLLAGGWANIAGSEISLHHGRLAIEVRGVSF